MSQAETTYLDFNTVVVGSKDTKKITLVNSSDVNLHYRLNVEQRIEGPYSEQVTRYDPCGELKYLYQVYVV